MCSGFTDDESLLEGSSIADAVKDVVEGTDCIPDLDHVKSDLVIELVRLGRRHLVSIRDRFVLFACIAAKTLGSVNVILLDVRGTQRLHQCALRHMPEVAMQASYRDPCSTG